MFLSIEWYRAKALSLTCEQFRAQYPAPVLVGQQIRGGRLKTVRREVMWPIQTRSARPVTLLHIHADAIADDADDDLLRDRPFTISLCVPVHKTPGFVVTGEAETPDELPPNAITVGRFRNADVVINDYTVSKAHAWFIIDPVMDNYWVTDAGSTNGTYVDNRRLRAGQRVSVVNNQRVTFGRLVFMFFAAREFYEHLVSHSGRTVQQEVIARTGSRVS